MTAETYFFALRFFITRSTSAEAFLEYFRAMMVLSVAKEIICAAWESSTARNTLRRHPEVRALARLEG